MFWFSKSKRQNNGFTLIEMLIVMVIIVIMSAIIFANYGKQRRYFALQRSVHKLAQDIRRANEMAMSAQEFQGSVPEGGYGIWINTASSTSYLLFADLGSSPDHIYSGESEKVEEIDLEKGVYIKDIIPSSYSILNITFKPPNPTVTISNEDGTSTTTEATVILSLEGDPSVTRSVKVNLVGLVDID
ncbi:type II secretion system protein [bacterium]|nr:type II secretion system protein [bacterium]